MIKTGEYIPVDRRPDEIQDQLDQILHHVDSDQDDSYGVESLAVVQYFKKLKNKLMRKKQFLLLGQAEYKMLEKILDQNKRIKADKDNRKWFNAYCLVTGSITEDFYREQMAEFVPGQALPKPFYDAFISLPEEHYAAKYDFRFTKNKIAYRINESIKEIEPGYLLDHFRDQQGLALSSFVDLLRLSDSAQQAAFGNVIEGSVNKASLQKAEWVFKFKNASEYRVGFDASESKFYIQDTSNPLDASKFIKDFEKAYRKHRPFYGFFTELFGKGRLKKLEKQVSDIAKVEYLLNHAKANLDSTTGKALKSLFVSKNKPVKESGKSVLNEKRTEANLKSNEPSRMSSLEMLDVAQEDGFDQPVLRPSAEPVQQRDVHSPEMDDIIEENVLDQQARSDDESFISHQVSDCNLDVNEADSAYSKIKAEIDINKQQDVARHLILDAYDNEIKSLKSQFEVSFNKIREAQLAKARAVEEELKRRSAQKAEAKARARARQQEQESHNRELNNIAFRFQHNVATPLRDLLLNEGGLINQFEQYFFDGLITYTANEDERPLINSEKKAPALIDERKKMLSRTEYFFLLSSQDEFLSLIEPRVTDLATSVGYFTSALDEAKKEQLLEQSQVEYSKVELLFAQFSHVLNTAAPDRVTMESYAAITEKLSQLIVFVERVAKGAALSDQFKEIFNLMLDGLQNILVSWGENAVCVYGLAQEKKFTFFASGVAQSAAVVPQDHQVSALESMH